MYKALKSFSGTEKMTKGEVKDLNDENVIRDLLNAGYIEEVKDETKNVKNEIKIEVEKVVDKVEEGLKKRVSKKKAK